MDHKLWDWVAAAGLVVAAIGAFDGWAGLIAASAYIVGRIHGRPR